MLWIFFFFSHFPKSGLKFLEEKKFVDAFSYTVGIQKHPNLEQTGILFAFLAKQFGGHCIQL